MPKAKKSSKKMRFDYTTDRKKLKKKFIKKNNPRIDNRCIRNAWEDNKSMSRNLQEMGLTFDPNRSLPLRKDTVLRGDKPPVVTKPYVLDQLEMEASRPEKDTKTLSSDLIEYVQHMIREHGDDYKAMARDEKNYYQDTPKQIKRKINEYRRCHAHHHDAFILSLTPQHTQPSAQ
ncbi:nucleolar protein 16 [Gouania willdenowi]|uniref:Nucleolar protein 16 n=1 Tax=Gouania willdenowi TaxID=441366 RepID=A0A8C5EHY6_GOUWI|nr:nucleolar protein 16 [Gouania willdenowi]